MKNFPVTIDGKEYWISRSASVVCIIIDKTKPNAPKLVAGKRGKGCPDEVGKWNLPSGFIDYNETINGSASRETKEECGLNIPENAWRINSVNSNPNDNPRQTISFRMVVEWKPEYGTEFSTENSEPDEVDEVRWIGLEEVEKLDWAFHHEKIAKRFLKPNNK